MRRSVKIHVKGKIDHEVFIPAISEWVENLNIHGVLQIIDNRKLVVYAVGDTENIELLIDNLYDSDNGIEVEDLEVRPLEEERDFHGIFRVINGRG